MARKISPITSIPRLEALTGRQRQTYTRTLQARRLMEAGMSREQAAREAKTTSRAMSRYLGDAVYKRGGRWHLDRDAELYSYVRVPTTSGVQTLEASSKEADLARKYRDALWRYMNFDDDSDLVELEGQSIQGFTLETDAAHIDEMIHRGELDPSEVGSGETARA